MSRHGPPRLDLFPFLSVLLCTLGSLSLLLLVLTEQARQSRESDAATGGRNPNREEARTATPSVPEDIRAVLLLEELWHIEQSARYLDDELARYQQRCQTIRRQCQVVERANIRQRLQTEAWIAEFQYLISRRQMLVERQRELARMLEATVQTPGQALEKLQAVYQLVPHPSQGGTWRPPIVVEAVNDRAVFVATGLAIAANDENAAQQFRQAVLQARQQLSDNDRPYILLLVRPSGFVLHYLVPRWLEDTDWDIGYELVPEDWRMEYGELAAQDRPGKAPPAVCAEVPLMETSAQRWREPGQVLSRRGPTNRTGEQAYAGSGSDPPGALDNSDARAQVVSREPGSGEVPSAKAGPLGTAHADRSRRTLATKGTDGAVVTLQCREDAVQWLGTPRNYRILAEARALQSLLSDLRNWRELCTRAGIEAELRVQVEPAGTRLYYELAPGLAQDGWVWQVEWQRPMPADR